MDLSNLRTMAMRERDHARLERVHPYLAETIKRVLDAMEVMGYPMMVTAGVRTDEQQIALYAQGRTINGHTTPGAIVTNADGIVHKSMHQRQADGFGHAVDCAFIDDPDTVKIETWDPAQPWPLYGTMGETRKCTWGGRWQSPHDLPHLELSLTAKL